MKTPEKSRFGKLVAYLLDPQGKKTRVGEVVITNCVSTDTTWAVRELAATQRLNTRAKSDRTYHLLISLRAGENPDAQTLRVIDHEKRPRFGRVDTSQLWEEHQAQRELHKTLRQAKLVSLAASRAHQIEAVKAAARAKRLVIKMRTFTGIRPSPRTRAGPTFGSGT